MKMLIDDEVSGDVRHASPSIVGRLMGLDTMPSFGDRSHSTCWICSQFMSPGSYCDKYGFAGDVPHKRSTDQIPEFKDVFEIMESRRMKTRSLCSGCTNNCSGPDKVNSAEMNFVRQKFMDAKRLSTKESFKRSKEFDDALEALLFSILCCKRITVLKPSRRNKFVDADIIYPSEDTERCCHAPKGVKHSPTNPCANHSSQPPQENTSSFRQKYSRSSFKERIDTHCSPTRSVVLKPCLGKTENMEGAFPLTHEMFQSSYRKSKAPLDYGSAAQSRRTEEYMYHMPTGKFDVLGRGGKGSIEIACEVIKEMTRAVKGGISGNRIFSPDIGPFSCDAQASLLSSMAKLKSSEAYQRSNRCHDAWDGPNSGSSICCKCPKGELHRDGMPGLSGYPLGISSSDGWKDENVCNSTRLKSLPSSSITQKSLKMTKKKENSRLGEFSVLKDIVIVAHNNSEDELVHGRPMRSLVGTSTSHCNVSDLPSLDGDESMVTEREIHVNFEEPACSVAVPESSEERTVQPANSKHFLSAQCYLDSSYVVPERQDEDQASVSGNLVMHQESTWVLDDHIVSPSPNNSADEAEEHVLDQCVGHAFTSNPTEESVSHLRSREDDQPPVSVFESSLGTEDGCSGGFEKISADLQGKEAKFSVELRMQLRLLKIEATDNDDETELALSSDDGISTSCKPRNEAGSDVYGSLEKKYGKYILWPQSDRRLLFDLTNDALMGVVTSLTHSGMRKKWQSRKRGKEGVLDHVWERVCQQRREAECFKEERLMGVGWLDCEDVTYQIVGELESMLGADLLEEVAELLL
ncbi:hypothetical protein C2845_PM03G17270 [Panicum miliaceum]|uniref:DUF4378 domain-containing protein n=1 Tax=Panicum miliaceum TaxID=4540 RepID=A0A3L6TCL1_PANMI|nr:hypothetical protein C2845_PM03G17270 [Panicum miliaceum]